MRVAIVHPWLPQYRVNFFKQLIVAGVGKKIEFTIYYGETPPEWKQRRDAGLPDGFTKLPTKFFTFRGRSISRKSLRHIVDLDKYDLVIVEQAVRNLETYELLIGRRPLAFWGHGRTFTLRVSPLQDRFKQWLTRRGKWFFSYTSIGAESMARAGMDSSKITIVQNSIDTGALQREIASISEDQLLQFQIDHDLRGRTAIFIGGLDASKRIPFLLESATIAARLDPDFRLLVAGAGDDRSVVEEASGRLPFVKYLGPLFAESKALAMAAAQVVAMPGRVGLVAVDSFAALTPIVTTHWEWHSVEFEYLKSGQNAVVTENTAELYARGLVETLQNDSLLGSLRTACAEARDHYTLDAMVENFLGGVMRALDGENG